MAFNILGIRQYQDDDDELYPKLNADLSPVLLPADGIPGRPIRIRGLAVYHLVEGVLQRLSGSSDMKGEMWLTNERIIVQCKHYDKVKWDGSNALGSVLYGAGTETAFHLADKALHRVRSHGKAMVGHIYLGWLVNVSYQPHRGRKFPPAVRFQVTKQLADKSTKNLWLQVSLTDADAPELLAQRVSRSAAQWRRDKGGRSADQHEARLQEIIAASPMSEPAVGKLSVCQLPYFQYASRAPR